MGFEWHYGGEPWNLSGFDLPLAEKWYYKWIQMGRSEDDNGIIVIVDKLEVNQQEQRDDQQ
jgi:hypothetical protein